jgi:hypothetical protein
MAHPSLSVSGQPLSSGQLRQLQWIVPRPWTAELSQALTQLPLAGAGVRVKVNSNENQGKLAETECWMIGFFDGERMVEEALRPAAYPLLSARGLLPIGGCGRRGPGLYLVDVSAPSLPLWFHEGATLRELGVGLCELWAQCEPEGRVQLRRRVPQKTPRRLAKTTPRAATHAVAACKRTLSLFA